MNNWSTKPFVSAVAVMLVLGGAASASGGANKDEAVAMVKQAVAFIKEQGAEKAYPELTNKASKFRDRDLYVVVYQLDGKVLAHGSNEKFVGKDLIDAQDVDGKLYVKERVEMAGQAGIVLAGLQVRQSGEQESRAERDVLREAWTTPLSARASTSSDAE